MKEVKDYEAQSEKNAGYVSYFYNGIFHGNGICFCRRGGGR